MLYSIHGKHVDAAKLKKKLIKPFEPLIKWSDSPPVDKMLNFILEPAIRLDFALLACKLHIELIMHDTESGKLADFLFTWQPDPQDSKLLPHLFIPRMDLCPQSDPIKVPPEELEGLNVSYIAKPLARIYGQTLTIQGLPGAMGYSDDTSYVDYDKFKLELPLVVVLESP